MKKSFIITSILFLFSCSSNNDENSSSNATNLSTEVEKDTSSLVVETPRFESKIRTEEEIKVGETYTDTLTFLTFNDDYDYAFGVFLTQQNDSVYIVYGDIIDDVNSGRRLVASWEMDSLYEAGEGDELYFQERILSYEWIEM